MCFDCFVVNFSRLGSAPPTRRLRSVKNFSPLFTVSVALNLVLVAWLLLRPSLPTTPFTSSSSAALPSTAHASTSPAPLTASQSAALRSADLAQMKAAGVPDDVAHILAAGRAYAKMNALDQAHKKFRGDPRYWRNSRSDNSTVEQLAAETKANEEFIKAMERAFPEMVEAEAAATQPYLSADARKKLARIEKDYAEIENEIRSRTTSGVLLASDNDKLRLLKEEKKRDLAAALSPAEWEEFQLRDDSSSTVQSIRSNYGDTIKTEDDYRKIFALQKSFDDRYPARSDADPASRDTAYAQLRAEIIGVIGEASYAAFQHEHDHNYQVLTAITERLKLPSGTPDLVYAVRDRYAAESQAIAQNSALSPAARDTQLKALGEKAYTDLTGQLGPEGAQAYAVRTQWVHLLRTATPFSTNLKDAPMFTNVGVTEFAAPRRRP